MSTHGAALDLAAAGFHVFPCHEASKLPAINGFPDLATTDAAKINAWWATGAFNPAISTSLFNGGKSHLIVVDVDIKDGRRGDLGVLELEAEGFELPLTYTQLTPKRGQHLFYWSPVMAKNSAGKIKTGIDIRGKGGFALGRGAVLPEGAYTGNLAVPVARAPEWLIDATRYDDICAVSKGPVVAAPDATRRAETHLLCLVAAPEGRRNELAFKAAAQVKDFGVPEPECYVLMRGLWRSTPLLSDAELHHVVHSAYIYGQSAQGSASPQAEFTAVAAPVEASPDEPPASIEDLNERYAYALTGSTGTVLHFTKDYKGLPAVHYLAPETFHQYLAPQQVLVEEKRVPLTRIWMKSQRRRTYAGIVFAPGRDVGEKYYNLWRGFTVELQPADAAPSIEAKASLDAFLLHVQENVCGGDAGLARCLLGFFAHMVQRPEEKPLVALVFKGPKGVGKSTLIDRIGHLLGPHYGTASDPRYVTGNFNAHFERTLLFALEEAFWGGNKAAEGIIKTLVTSRTVRIERKGQDSFEIDSYLRLAILGNEDWQVPASADERRWAVFDVQLRTHKLNTPASRRFFHDMREGMERGGYAVLLRYLIDFDLADVDVNEAPNTAGLTEQKEISLKPFQQWWLECLLEGHLGETDFGGKWETQVDKERLRGTYNRYAKGRQITGWLPSSVAFGRALREVCPSVDASQKRKEGDSQVNVYRLPPLAQARAEWDRFIGRSREWV